MRKIIGKVTDFLNDPKVDAAIDILGGIAGAVIGEIIVKKTEGDTTKRTLNPEWVRREAPKLYAETHLDENLLREITYSQDLSAGNRTELFDRWGPIPGRTVWNHAAGEVGPHQWNDIRLTLVEEMCDITDPGIRSAKIAELGAFLTELSKIEPGYRLLRFVRLNYCKPREEDYMIVKMQRFGRNRVANLVQLQTWIMNTGPDGFVETAIRYYGHVETAATIAAPFVNVADDFLRDAADDINRGTNRGFFGLGRFLR
jgi:hypothetical protein